MKEINLTIRIIKKDETELDATDAKLLNHAKQATFRSYAPYSNFHVGAAALLDDGTIVEGSNQENCAYPSGICAERTTLFYAGSRYPERKVIKLCIAARGTDDAFTSRPIAPCGACRQVMLEVEERNQGPLAVMLYGTDGIYCLDSAKDLMPVTFDSSFL